MSARFVRPALVAFALAGVLVLVLAPAAAACPFCDGGPDGVNEVRDGIFDEQFWPRVAATVAPFPVLAGVVWIAMAASGAEDAMAATAAITTWVAMWWVFEPVPIPATSLLPFALLPLTGVLKSGEAGAALGDSVILLLLGAFLLSKALEKSGVHERFAAAMIRLVGRHGGGRPAGRRYHLNRKPISRDRPYSCPSGFSRWSLSNRLMTFT